MASDPVLALHLLGVIVAVGAVVVTDAFTVVAKVRPRAMKVVVLLSPFFSLLVWGGFFLLSVSGILLVYRTSGYVSSPVFQQKMILVGIVFVNGIVLNERIVPRFEEFVARDVYEFPPRFKAIAGVSTTISMLGWFGTVYISYFRLF